MVTPPAHHNVSHSTACVSGHHGGASLTNTLSCVCCCGSWGAVVRRLVGLGLLTYNASLQRYTMHKLVREAAQLLVHNLGKSNRTANVC